MSKESYIAESEALNKLFNNMTQRKVDAAEKEKLKKEENKGEQVEAKKPLQAAPTTSRPIHSEYLEKKKKEEEEAKRIEEARRAKMRKQIEKEEAEPLCCPPICQVQAGGGQDFKVDSGELRRTSCSLRY